MKFKLPDKPARAKAIVLVLSLGISACTALAFAARFLAFWTMPGSSRLFYVGLGVALLVLPVYLLLRVFRRCWFSLNDTKKKNRFVIAAFIGGLLWFLAAVFLARIPTWHTLKIETLPVENQPGSYAVKILEVRGYDRRIINPEAFGVSGNWQVIHNGFTISGNQPASLNHTFYAQDGKAVQILIEKGPQGGRALFWIDGASRHIDFGSATKDQEILTFPLHGSNRWSGFIFAADFIVSLGLAAVLFFVVSFYAAGWMSFVRLRIPSISYYQNMIFVVVFLGLLLMPLYQFSDTLPNFETRFSYRSRLLFGWSNFRFRVLGDRLFKRVMIGKGNWLIYTGEESLDDYQNTLPVSDHDLAGLQTKLDDWNDRLKAKGIMFLVVVVPNKNTIYPEFFPPQVPVLGKKSFLDQFLDYQRLHGKAQVLDLRPALLKGRQVRQVYYPADTHWNPYGALIGYQEILGVLQKDYPVLQPHALDDYQFVDEGVQNGDMAGQLGQITVKERYFHLDLKDGQPVNEWETQDLNSIKITTTARPGAALPKLVMYRDSFSYSLIPFLKDHFRRAVFVWSFKIDESFIDAEKPDIVTIEVTERYLTRLLKSLNNEKTEDSGGLPLDE